jgi:hypothetical protein
MSVEVVGRWFKREVHSSRAFGAEQRGAALIEFAIVGSMLVGMVLPLADIGMGFYYKTRVMTAAEAGAQYASPRGYWNSSNNTSPQTNICSAVIKATGLGNSNDCSGGTNTAGNDILIYSADPTKNDPQLGLPNFSLACYCVNATNLTLINPKTPPSTPWSPSDSTKCTGLLPSTCTDVGGQNQPPGVYVTVRTRYTYTPPFSYLTFGNRVTLSAASTVRIQ